MKISNIKPGPIRQLQLSDEQMVRIQKMHQALFEVYNVSLEKTLDNFQRDVFPDAEIAIWEEIAKAYTMFSSSNTLTLEEKKAVFEILLLRSMADEQYVLKNLKTKIFPLDQITHIMSHYHPPAQQNFEEISGNNQNNVIIDKVQIEASNEEIAANIDINEISSFMATVERKVQETFATNKTEFYMILEFIVYPSKPYMVRMAIQKGLDEGVLQKLKVLKGELDGLGLIHSKVDEIMFQAGFSIKAKG